MTLDVTDLIGGSDPQQAPVEGPERADTASAKPKLERAKELIRPFLPWTSMPEVKAAKRKKSSRHRRGDDGPDWEYRADRDEPDDESHDRAAKRAKAKEGIDRKRAAAWNLGSSRARKLGVGKRSLTTAQACAAYPLGVHSASMKRGMFLGHDRLGGGGAFIYDPFEALDSLVKYGVTNTNMMLFGQPGYGKSALIKTMLERMAAVYGNERLTVVCDVKGEYETLAARMGLQHVQLHPGGGMRVNPLEFVGRAKSLQDVTSARISSIEALATMVFPHRDSLTMVEKRMLGHVCERFAERPSIQPTISDVVEGLNVPTQAMADDAKMTAWELQRHLTDLRLAITELRGAQFGGMFDGHSTLTMDPDSAGVVIDISKAAVDDNALALVWVAASTWLRMLMLREDGRRKIQVFDESWKMVRYEPLALFLQDSWKLARSKGGANIAILHRLSDLSSQASDGSVTAKVAQGLISDTAVRVTYRQTPRDLAQSAEVVGYGEGERARIAMLGQGESFWKMGDLSAQLNHQLYGESDAVLCDTNSIIRDGATA